MLSVFYIGGVHYTFTALEFVGRWFSESDPLGVFFFLGRSHNQLCGWILHDHDGALSNIRFQEHLAQTTNIACSTTVQWLGWCVTWETDDTIWIRLIFFNYIHNHSYICVHFQHGPLKTLTNFPSQISGEVQWPLILTGSDVCSWKGQKAS